MKRSTIAQTIRSHAAQAPSIDVPAEADWRAFSACRFEDPDLFFPSGTTGPAALQIEEAKAVCRRCPVMETCGDWALASGQSDGVWGGMSEAERRRVQRRAARLRAQTGS
ncbi:WhiB family transcriptional regulator [Streptomyces sp. NPDC091217]|uniref:WhiB family transcriptional regulator n=1 Tax=Streptomyces sp. NPDC091217 TaxID=3365975 RepID=UPI0037FD50CA